MKERIWLSNYSLDDIQGGTEIVGEQYCRSLKLKYLSARRMGISPFDTGAGFARNNVILADLMSKKLERYDIDLLFYNSLNCWSQKAKAEKSIAVCCENFRVESECMNDTDFSQGKLIDWDYQKKALSNADKIITLSKGEQEAFEKDGFKSMIIEPYLNLESFYPKDIVKKEPTAIFVGRRHPRKGYDIVLELEKRLPGLKFIKVTDGNISTEALNDLYNQSHFMIMPSRYESFGFIYAEALATNLPIISSRVGLFSDWQPDEYGIFPKETTVDAFEDAILHELPKHTFKSSRKLAEERFSFNRFRRETNDFVNNW